VTGVPQRATLLAGSSHDYAFELRSGEALRLLIDQRGVDLVAEVYDPAARLVVAIDGPTSDQGRELVCFVVRSPGRHLLRLRPWVNATTGEYEVLLTRRGAAGTPDYKCAAAVQALGRAQRRQRENGRRSAGLFESYRTAGDLFRAAGERGHETIAHREGCGVLLDLGRISRAAACYQTTLERAPDDPEQETELLNLLGLARRRLGELPAARSCFDRAFAVSRAHHHRAGEASALNNLALLDRQQSLHHQAITRLEAALKIWRALGQRNDESASLHNLGSIYTELGHFDEALDLLTSALAIRRERARPDLVAGTLVEIGWAHYLVGAPNRAARYFQEAVEIYRTSGQPLGEAAALDRLGSALRQAGRPGPAFTAYHRSLALSEEAGDLLSVTHTRANLGWLLIEHGHAAQARRELTRALESFRRLDEPDGRAHVLVGLAAVARSQGDLGAARRLLEEALELVEEIRASGRRRGHWIQSIALWHDYSERSVDLLLELHRRGETPDALRRAFELSDWTRNRYLYDMLLESGASLRSGIAPRLQAEEARVQERLNAVARQHRTSRARPGDRRAYERSLRSLLQDYRRVEASIRAADPRIDALSRPARVRFAEIQCLLDQQTRLISYFLGERRSFVFVLGPASVEVYELPARSKVEAIAQLAYQGLAHSNQTRARRQAQLAARALAGVLLGPVRLPSEVSRLFIVAEGGLLYIPFAALPQPGAGAGEESLLIDRYEIVHLPSAAALVALRQRGEQRRRPAKALAILANPVFSQDDPRLRRSDALAPSGPPGPIELPPLPFTRQEAESIAARVPESLRLTALGFDARRDLVLSGALADYRIVHFATHALIDEVHPELSGLVLSAFDEHGGARQAELRLHEIYGLDLPADLVVLSACRTALGRRIRGDGIIGLTQGFLYAGSSRVAVSLWDAEDSATALLMSRFYRQLLTEGRPPATALREAQLWLRRQPRWQPPYYWAGFILQGDGFLPLTPPPISLPTNQPAR
jgi:CHAT domain-containing protein